MSGESSGDLTARSAAACENAKSPRSACKCRCGGAAHGLARGAVRDLGGDDPHHPDDESPAERKARLREEARRARLALFSRPRQPDPLPATLPAGTTTSFSDMVSLSECALRSAPGGTVDSDPAYWAIWDDGSEKEGFVRPHDIDWGSVARLRTEGTP